MPIFQSLEVPSLTHDHFQGGHYEFAMERAAIEKNLSSQDTKMSKQESFTGHYL